MMNVKKYRATTTREALEMIKQDLGEDAFVLETKQVRKGGFLGFNAATQVEISAAIAPSIVEKPVAKNTIEPSLKPKSILNLKDDTIAAPASTATEENQERKNILQALNSRAALSKDFEFSAPFAAKQKIEAVELNPEAPRFVHPKKEIPKQILPEQNLVLAETSENAPTLISSRELDLLRAELREVKFSLGAFANRQVAVPAAQKNPNLKEFEEVFDSPFYDAYMQLTETGIPTKTARKLIAEVIPHYKSGFVNADKLAHFALHQGISSQVKFESNLLEQITPVTMAIIGATGVGKTTTIAKLAARATLQERRRVELVTLDTYRIAAVEQLKTYAEIIGAGCHVVRSVFELDAILHRLPSDAITLIDTTGRNPHDLADQFEFSDYLRQHSDIRKCLAVPATINSFDGITAIKKFEMYGADCLALTKMDETLRPGAMLDLVAESSLPLAYFCMGQRVPEDLQSATAESFTDRILHPAI